MCSSEFSEISKNTFFPEHFRATASERHFTKNYAIRKIRRTSVNSCLSTREYKKYTLFYKQPVCEQQALGWQIAKQLSGLNPLSLSNNKNCRSKESGVFPL